MLKLCPTCGTPAAATHARDQCPTCLLRIGLDPDPAAEDLVGAADTVVDPQSDPQPSFDPAADAVSAPMPAGRLQLLDEIARGGVGAVLRAYDATLGRELAVKVLQARHRDRADLIERFIAEARIAGQLQHPGIVPVYELSALADQRPYFAMKLVKGRTLADLLATRSDQDRSALLRILLRVSEALAYAHERGVVHLDVKPGNIMVGKHGEVQLMDWGLAQVTARLTDPSVPAPAETSSPEFRRHAGTPAFMAPERFHDHATLDARCDVFALGAILCDILTGRALYDAGTPTALRTAAQQADTTAPLARLADPDVPPDLAELVRACVARRSDDRPANASAVAARLAQHFTTVESRARAAEIARARAEASAAGERKRRRLTVGLALSGLALVVTVGAGLFAAQSAQNAITAARAMALEELRTAAAIARNDPAGDPQLWRAAREVAQRIAPVFSAADESNAYARLAADVEQRHARARSDQQLLHTLERARAAADNADYLSAAEQIEQAFADAGMQVLDAPESVGAALADRPPLVRADMLAAIDIWGAILASPRMATAHQQGRAVDVASAAALRTAVSVAVATADPDPWRDRLRAAYRTGDPDALLALLDSTALERQPAPSLWLAAKFFAWRQQPSRALEILESARDRFPADFWVNHELAVLLHRDANRPADALAYATAAVSLRPDARIARLRRALILEDLGRIADAEAVLRAVIAEAPQYGPAYYRLANLLNFYTNRYAEAVELYALAEQYEPVRAQPARIALGDALLRLGRSAEAVPVYERAVAWSPDDLVSVCMLARAYVAQAQLADARALIDRAADLQPDNDLQADLRADVTREVAHLGLLMETPWNESLEPLSQAERLELAQLAEQLDLPARAARLYAAAMEADPVLAADQERYIRWTAATQAVAAGAGDGEDVPRPTPAERAAFFDVALDWLEADLSIQRERLAARDPAQRAAAVEWLRYAWQDACFAAVRVGDPPGAAIGDGWVSFWADVLALLE